MAKQTFKTPLNFQEVEVGTSEDKVLVRTADGDVKEVPSDSFGGGGSQDLQQTLENGNTTIDKMIVMTGASQKATIIENGSLILQDQALAVPRIAPTLIANYEKIQLSNFLNESDATVLRRNKLEFNNWSDGKQRDNASISKVPTISGSETERNTDLVIPDIDGEYTMPVSVNGNFADANGNITVSAGGSAEIPTLDEVLGKQEWAEGKNIGLFDPVDGNIFIKLEASQGRIRGGGQLEGGYTDFTIQGYRQEFGTTVNGGTDGTVAINTMRLVDGEAEFIYPEKEAGSYIFSTTDDITIQNALSVNNRTDKGIKIQQADPSEDAFVSYVVYDSEGINGRGEFGGAYYYSSDGMRISASGGGELTYTSGNRSLEWNADTENPRKTRLSLDRTTDGESVFSFPERDGNFTLVTASDIAVSNNTTTVLSASDLNTAYPIAIVGTQVHCLSITTGAVIYTKTAVGWVQHSVTTVS